MQACVYELKLLVFICGEQPLSIDGYGLNQLIISSWFLGAEHVSNALKSSMQAAQSKVEEMRKLQLVAQKSLAEMKAEEIQRMAEYASSINLQDLEDVPEAYLRED